MDVVASANSLEFDHELTSAGLKSRSAVGLPQCYLPLRSTGEIAGETARVHHAARRGGGVAAGGAGAAGGQAADHRALGCDYACRAEPIDCRFCAAIARTRLD